MIPWKCPLQCPRREAEAARSVASTAEELAQLPLLSTEECVVWLRGEVEACSEKGEQYANVLRMIVTQLQTLEDHQDVPCSVAPACDQLKAENERQAENVSLLLALLDKIELEDDASLAQARFQIAEQLGYTVKFGVEGSGNEH